MNLGSNFPTPLWLLYEDEIEGWRTGQTPLARQWLVEQNFKGEKHRVVLLPDANGGLAAAVAGLGKRLGELSLWHAAGLAERLPTRRFRLAQEFTAAEATQLALGFAYGAYRFDRYRSSKSELASLDPPANADMAYVANAAESLRSAHGWINCESRDFGRAGLAGAVRYQHLGRRFRPRATCCRGTQGGRSAAGRVQGIGRGGSARPNLPRHSP